MKFPFPMIVLFLLLFSRMVDGSPLPSVKEVRLSNGMKFLLVPRGEAPIFSAIIRFRVGGMEEQAGRSGLAHLLEHMAFKGTHKLTETELARLIEEQGGEDFNATTSKDMTSYTVSFPSDRLRFWAEIESERIFHPVFRDFEKERRVVLEERRMRIDDNPDGRLFEEMFRQAYSDNPYSWPTIGKTEDLQKITADDLTHFWRTHYHPANAVGILVGRFDPKEAEKLIRETFGRIPSRSRRIKSPQIKPAVQGEKRFQLQEKAAPRLAIAYPKPTIPSREDYIFDLIEQILGDGRTSRLYRRLILKEKMVSDVEIFNGLPGVRATNLFWVGLLPLEGKGTEEVLKTFDEEVERFLQEGPTEREVERALNRIQSELQWGLKTNMGLASKLSYFEVAAGSWRYLDNYMEIVSTIRPEEIRKVAADYLSPSRRVIGVLGP